MVSGLPWDRLFRVVPPSRRPKSCLDDPAHRRQGALQFESLEDFFRQRFARAVFTVGEDHPGFAWSDGAEPGEQVRLAGVRAEAAERVDLRLYRDSFTVDAHELLAFDQSPPQRLAALVADGQHMGVRLPEVLLEVVKNASCVAHAGASHD